MTSWEMRGYVDHRGPCPKLIRERSWSEEDGSPIDLDIYDKLEEAKRACEAGSSEGGKKCNFTHTASEGEKPQNWECSEHHGLRGGAKLRSSKNRNMKKKYSKKRSKNKKRSKKYKSHHRRIK